jgi:hypothetical protein
MRELLGRWLHALFFDVMALKVDQQVLALRASSIGGASDWRRI